MGHTSTGKHRGVGKPQGVAARAAGQAGGLAGGCSEHVSHGSRVGMEGIHRAETSRRRLRTELVPCPCDASQISCSQVVTATSPMLPTSPAPPSCSNAPMCRHGKLRPRHLLPQLMWLRRWKLLYHERINRAAGFAARVFFSSFTHVRSASSCPLVRSRPSQAGAATNWCGFSGSAVQPGLQFSLE